MRDCALFLEWLNKASKDIISFIDESLCTDYAINSWWIDSGVTIHVINSMQRLKDIIDLRKGERVIRVPNGIEIDVEAVGQLPLVLNIGFTLSLRNVLFVPSMRGI